MTERSDWRDVLRASDPYDGAGLAAAETTRLRARIRAASADPVAPGRSWAAAGGIAAGLAVLALTFLISRATPDLAVEPDAGPVAATVAPTYEVPAPPDSLLPSDRVRLDAVRVSALKPPVTLLTAAEPAVRNVRLTAPRGTRIIWTLDPAFGDNSQTANGDPSRFQGADPR
ncbi:MAG: hypothetical protein GKS06_05750 [Acidobacteria bacterium]|nr:hypothetical protein [Acidobacteriota bacterium]